MLTIAYYAVSCARSRPRSNSSKVTCLLQNLLENFLGDLLEHLSIDSMSQKLEHGLENVRCGDISRFGNGDNLLQLLQVDFNKVEPDAIWYLFARSAMNSKQGE